MTTRPRVLAIAEAANPEWVSVPLVGWSLASALRNVADVHIVTHIRNKDAIERAGLVHGKDFTAIDSEAVARPMFLLAEKQRGGSGKGWTTLQVFNAISYRYFERLVWQRFQKDIRNGSYDIVHRITPLTPTISSKVALHCRRASVPFVMGPLNGGVPWPKGFDTERRQEREWLSYIRSAYKLIPGRFASLEATKAIIVGSRHTESEIPSSLRDRCVYIPENGIDTNRFSGVAATPSKPMRACFIGRMVPYKGPDMLIEAAAPHLKSGALTIDMLGDGPMLDDLKAQAASLGVGDAVTFHGWVDHKKVQDVAAKCSLLTFPSIREFGGGVVLEAMALGLVPVIVDYAGPGELVGPDTGFKVPIGPREEIVAGFRKTLSEILANPGQVERAGSAARARVESHFTWERKAEQVREVYDWVLGHRPERPNPLGTFRPYPKATPA